MLFCIQRDAIARFKRQECVLGKIGDKYLRHRSRQAVEIVYETAERAGVSRINVGRNRKTSVAGGADEHRPSSSREGYRWSDIDASRLPALIDVAIETEVDSTAENVRATNETQVIQQLRRCHPTRCAWRIKIGRRHGVREKRRHVRPFGIGLTLRE